MIAAFLKQIASFFGGRAFTLVVEEAILAIFITWLRFDSMIVKVSAQVIVIILNYVISKLIVFRKQGQDRRQGQKGPVQQKPAE